MIEGLNERANMEITNTLQKQVDLALGGAEALNFPDVLSLPKMKGMVLVKEGSAEAEKRPAAAKVTVFNSPGGNYILCHA